MRQPSIGLGRLRQAVAHPSPFDARSGNSLSVQPAAAKPAAGDHGRSVTPISFISLLPALLGLFAVQSGGIGQSVTRLVGDDEMILRVPVQPRPMQRREWMGRKGPKCIPVGAIGRALLSGSDRVDFVLLNRRRIRAEFEDRCPALDFYGGLYLRTDDGRLCAGRDAVHSRMGGSCTIGRFRQLVPKDSR